MIKKLLIVFIIFFQLIGCKTNNLIHEKHLKTTYPISHIYDLPIQSLHDSILSYFSIERQLSSKLNQNSIFYYNTDFSKKKIKHQVIFSAETSKNQLFSKDFFTTSGNENDIYIHSFGQYWYSSLYFVGNKPLEFRSQFGLKLMPIDSTKTLLKIEIISPKVLNGTEGQGPHGPYSKEVSVKSTTIEEYSLLFYIAEQIGDTTLLPLDLGKNIIEK